MLVQIRQRAVRWRESWPGGVGGGGWGGVGGAYLHQTHFSQTPRCAPPSDLLNHATAMNSEQSRPPPAALLHRSAPGPGSAPSSRIWPFETTNDLKNPFGSMTFSFVLFVQPLYLISYIPNLIQHIPQVHEMLPPASFRHLKTLLLLCVEMMLILGNRMGSNSVFLLAVVGLLLHSRDEKITWNWEKKTNLTKHLDYYYFFKNACEWNLAFSAPRPQIVNLIRNVTYIY